MVDKVQYDLSYCISPLHPFILHCSPTVISPCPQTLHSPSQSSFLPLGRANLPTSQNGVNIHTVLQTSLQVPLSQGETSQALSRHSHKTTVAFMTYHCFNLLVPNVALFDQVSVTCPGNTSFHSTFLYLDTMPGTWLAQNTCLLKLNAFNTCFLPTCSHTYHLSGSLGCRFLSECPLDTEVEAPTLLPRWSEETFLKYKSTPNTFQEVLWKPPVTTGTLATTVEAILGMINCQQVHLISDLGPLHLYQQAFLLCLAGQVDIRARQSVNVCSSAPNVSSTTPEKEGCEPSVCMIHGRGTLWWKTLVSLVNYGSSWNFLSWRLSIWRNLDQIQREKHKTQT